MGYASTGACFPTQTEALNHWCALIQPGAYSQTCSNCDATTSSCNITQLLDNGTFTTSVYPVSTPPCDVPTPVSDALTYTGAIITLWLAVYAAKTVYNLFRLPTHDAN